MLCVVVVLEKHPSSLGNSIWYSDDYRKVESDLKATGEAAKNRGIKNNARYMYERRKKKDVVFNDKYLIFTTGTSTFVPHQIGKSELRRCICHS